MSEVIGMQYITFIMAPCQGANHFAHCDGGFLSPVGFVTRRYPMLRHCVAFSGSRRCSACGNNLPSWGTERIENGNFQK